MINDPFKERMLSVPLCIFWEGFSTNTFELQKFGWMLSADQDVNNRFLKIFFKHKQYPIYGVTSCIDFNYFDLIGSRDITLNASLCSDFIMRDYPRTGNVFPINAEPAISIGDDQSIKRFNWFRSVDSKVKVLTENEQKEFDAKVRERFKYRKLKIE